MTFQKGCSAWNKGLTKETDERVAKCSLNIGEKNGMWKGDKVGYNKLHEWVGKRKPKPKFCEKCKKQKKLELANKEGNYTRNPNDYFWLCRKCHTLLDIKLGIRKKDKKTGRYI